MNTGSILFFLVLFGLASAAIDIVLPSHESILTLLTRVIGQTGSSVLENGGRFFSATTLTGVGPKAAAVLTVVARSRGTAGCPVGEFAAAEASLSGRVLGHGGGGGRQEGCEDQEECHRDGFHHGCYKIE
jgi:hypothetical protein